MSESFHTRFFRSSGDCKLCITECIRVGAGNSAHGVDVAEGGREGRMVGVGDWTSTPLAVSEGLGFRERVIIWCLRVSRIAERLVARRPLKASAIATLTMF